MDSGDAHLPVLENASVGDSVSNLVDTIATLTVSSCLTSIGKILACVMLIAGN